MAEANLVDGKYYEATPPRSLSERLVVAARDRIYADFLRTCAPGRDTTILDVGVSDVINDAANVLERSYPHRDRVTAVGLGHPDSFHKAYPDIAYRQVVPNQALPFADSTFDVAVSNAVLEHVGSPDNQHLFVSELCRVARRVFITVPHRFFPVEHHTAIPLLHYSDATFRLACRALGKAPWSEASNLILMSRAHLASLAPTGHVASVGYTGIKLGWFSSNLYLSATRAPAVAA
ncbi:MAG TPA: methyltransferase domain-containing protein [Vineibacter sp.]|nr:methyltransferase domain-containing protein [Vineibacter sp.]